MLRTRNLAFMREVAFIVGPSDFTFLVDHVLGLPKVGWAVPAHGQTPRYSPPELPIDSLMDDLETHNEKIIRETKPSLAE